MIFNVGMTQLAVTNATVSWAGETIRHAYRLIIIC